MVGDEAITVQSFEAYLGAHGALNAGPNEREHWLTEMVRSEAAALKAKAAGYETRPEIKAELERLATLRFKEDELAKRQPAEPTREEIEAYYRTNQARFSTPERVRAALIFLSVPSNASSERAAETRARAEELRVEALKGSSNEQGFGRLAQKYSEDQATRYRGGDLGFMTVAELAERLGPELAKAVSALTGPGSVSLPLQGSGGLYLLKCISRESATCRPLSEVRDGVAYLLRRGKEAEAEREFYADCARGISIRMNADLLEHTPPPAAPSPPPTLPETQTAFAK
ncbi:MAG: peptidylprolyl isomerase [Limisphaerales bacterium]